MFITQYLNLLHTPPKLEFKIPFKYYHNARYQATPSFTHGWTSYEDV